jgi:predicted phosphoribosyltransferase
VPVAVAVASGLDLLLDVAVASKITPPWNTELGYGAVAFDDSVLINQPLVRQLGLTDAQVQAGTDLARRKVHRRLELLRLGRGPLHLAGRAVLLVDDGLATGYTLLAAHGAIRAAGAGSVIPAVPTAHVNSLQAVAGQFSAVYCPNIRSGGAFAVAGAYRNWDDVTEARARQLLEEFWRGREGTST